MKSIKNIILVAGAAMLCWSCTEYLTTPPVGSLSPEGFYSTPSHAEEGVLGVYSKLRNMEANQYSILSEDRSDNVWVDPAPNGIRSCSEVSFLRFDSTLSEAKSVWSGWYSLIFNANTVLENLEDVEFTDESIKDQFKGELLFLRAYAHFELVRTFGNVPVVDHVLSVNESKELVQQAGKDVINDSVIPDLKEAESLLPYEADVKDYSGNKIGGSGRADKIVAEAMLARVYMTLKGFPYNDSSAKANAKTYLEKVLNYSVTNGNKYWAPTIDDWKKQWLTEPSISNKYQIFSIQHTNQSGNAFTGIESVSMSGEYLPYGGGGSLMSPCYIDMDLWYEYTSNNDQRGLGFTFMDGYEAWGSTTKYSNTMLNYTNSEGKSVDAYELSIVTKFCPYEEKRVALGVSYDDQTSTSWPLNYPLIRLEDMQLYYAELLVEDGNIASAMGYVNNIRKRAGVPEVSTSCSSSDALSYIKRERRLELFQEGIRWFDQVRYGEWDTTTKAKFDRHKIDGAYQSGVSADNIVAGKYLCPIPLDEINAVPGLYTQNEGWN